MFSFGSARKNIMGVFSSWKLKHNCTSGAATWCLGQCWLLPCQLWQHDQAPLQQRLLLCPSFPSKKAGTQSCCPSCLTLSYIARWKGGRFSKELPNGQFEASVVCYFRKVQVKVKKWFCIGGWKMSLYITEWMLPLGQPGTYFWCTERNRRQTYWNFLN